MKQTKFFKMKTGMLLIATTTLVSAHGLEWWMLPFATTYAPTDYTTHISTQSSSKNENVSRSLKFIEDNRESLEIEVAKGAGEGLDTLATLYEELDIKSEEEKEAWKLRLQENYEKIFELNGVSTSDELVDYMIQRLISPIE